MKRKGFLDVDVDIKELMSDFDFPKEKDIDQSPKDDRITVAGALAIVIEQMEASGFRDRTMSDYAFYVRHFQNVTKVEYICDISADSIYAWLNSMSVRNQTKLTRLKCLKAFLTRCFDNHWIETKFWKTISIKVDRK